jgi:hypothetical protein
LVKDSLVAIRSIRSISSISSVSSRSSLASLTVSFDCWSDGNWLALSSRTKNWRSKDLSSTLALDQSCHHGVKLL